MASTNRGKTRTLADIKKKTKRSRRSVRICLAGDLYDEHQQLERELEEMLADDSTVMTRMNQIPPSIAKAKQVQEIEQKMRDAEETFTFESIAPVDWRKLIEANPSKEGNLRWDPESFWPAAVIACCVSPSGMGDNQDFWDWWRELSAAVQQRLAEAAVQANEVQPSVPFSVSASATLRSSVPSSTTAFPSGSPGPSTSDE